MLTINLEIDPQRQVDQALSFHHQIILGPIVLLLPTKIPDWKRLESIAPEGVKLPPKNGTPNSELGA